MKRTTFPALMVTAALIGAPMAVFAQTADPAPAPDATTTPAPDATTPEVMPEATTPDAAAPEAAAPDATAPAVVPDATAPAATDMATGFIAPEGYAAVPDMAAVTADQLKGVDVQSSDGSSIAEISDVELAADGKVTGVIVDVGGFLGMGTHTVKLGLDQIGLFQNVDGDLLAHVSMDKDALKALPEYVAPVQ